MEESWRRKWKVVRKWNVIVWKGVLFLFSVFYFHDVDGLRVRNSRHSTSSETFVFGKFVRKPNCSRSEAFVNRGLTVLIPFPSQQRSRERFWMLRCMYIACHLSQYLTNLMHKICFTIGFISCLYMFRAHVLISRRSKLHYTASGIITLVGVMIPEAV
jgi:hypothetical protein